MEPPAPGTPPPMDAPAPPAVPDNLEEVINTFLALDVSFSSNPSNLFTHVESQLNVGKSHSLAPLAFTLAERLCERGLAPLIALQLLAMCENVHLDEEAFLRVAHKVITTTPPSTLQSATRIG